MSDPHWLVQELAGNAAWDIGKVAVIAAGAFAWRHRATILRKIPKPPKTVYLKGVESDERVGNLVAISGASEGVGEAFATLTVGSERTALWDVLASVGSERTALWNIEAPKRRQLKRLGDELLEFGAWYLHQS